MNRALRLLLGAVFVGAGVLHFAFLGAYQGTVPPGLPAPRALVLVSGVAEIAGGLGLWLPAGRLRRGAGWGLAALLVAVYPANVHMAVEGASWALWARLPLQGVLVAWALRVSGALYGSTSSNTPGQARRASARSAGA